jgi:eukaryotic-like serine/threonine-protein kinase
MSKPGRDTLASVEMNPSAKEWKERWNAISDQGGGGQSTTKRVRAKTGDNGDCFLKVLLRQSDPLRRSRMFREVSTYRTLNHPRIPKLLDTNVERFEDTKYKLYLVTELIEGETLERLIEGQGPLDVEPGIRLVIHLLDIVDYCHSNDTVHRDIKPDNIIVANGEPYLVDFGLSFNKNDAPAHGTPSQDELGNRFCRLPELSVGSGAKRDPRSDVTFCAGILLYVLTAKMPAVLIDEEGRMPYQRDSIRNALESNLPAQLIASVLALFDRSFQMRLSSRWETAAQFRGELERLLEPPRAHEGDVERLRAQVHKYADQPHVQHSTQSNAIIQGLLRRIHKVADQTKSKLGGAFEVSQTGYNVSENRGETWLVLQHPGRPKADDLWVKFRVDAVGSELVISAVYKDKEVSLGRMPLGGAHDHKSTEENIEALFYRQMSDLISR